MNSYYTQDQNRNNISRDLLNNVQRNSRQSDFYSQRNHMTKNAQEMNNYQNNNTNRHAKLSKFNTLTDQDNNPRKESKGSVVFAMNFNKSPAKMHRASTLKNVEIVPNHDEYESSLHMLDFKSKFEILHTKIQRLNSL